MKKILFLVNRHSTILGFREEVVKKFVDSGYEVFISCPDSEYTPKIESLGAKLIDIKMDRRGKNPFKDLALIKEYKKLFKELKPDIVLTYTIKPNVYGNYVAHKFHVPVISTVTGLGDAVLGGGLLQKLMSFLLKNLNKANTVFFQNSSDKEFCNKKKIALKNAKIVSGSGVNLEKFSVIPYPENDGITKFMFMGRVYSEKGVFELKKAYEKLFSENKNVSLTVVGDYKSGAEGLFDNLQSENIFYKGYQEDVRPFIEQADVIVNPSYREGMSNVLLEGAAGGRPLIATDIPGCREIVTEENGIKCEVKNVESLYRAMKEFADIPYENKIEMGKNSRKHVEKNFDRKDVVEKYYKIVNSIIEGKENV